jgi:hypothetical protein
MSAHDLISIAALLLVSAAGGSLLIVQGLTGVPPMSSNAAEARDVITLLKRAGLPDRAVIYDLGSGWGSLVVALAHAFPEADVRGIEISPLPYWVSRLRMRTLRNVSLHRGDFHKCDLSDAQAVTCYLMIKPMPRLAGLLDRALAPGTPVVSLSFWFRDRDVVASLNNAGLLGATALYYWPARKTDDAAQGALDGHELP